MRSKKRALKTSVGAREKGLLGLERRDFWD